MTFLHLNLHTDRSIGKGLIKPAALAARMKQTGVRAACVTDHANMSAAPELRKACIDHDITPIYGMEVNIAPRKEAKVKGFKQAVLLAKNREGFKNLTAICTVSAMYFYYIPRIDFEVLEKYGEGIICLTGDMGGVGAEAYFKGQDMGVAALWTKYTKVFGDDFYLELEPQPTDSQRAYNEALVRANKANPKMKLVLTGDPHYLGPEDADLHKALMAAANVRNPTWTYTLNGPYHVRTRDEMVEEMSDLHGFDVSSMPGFKQAFEAPDEILDKIEPFDIREGVKIPSCL